MQDDEVAIIDEPLPPKPLAVDFSLKVKDICPERLLGAVEGWSITMVGKVFNLTVPAKYEDVKIYMFNWDSKIRLIEAMVKAYAGHDKDTSSVCAGDFLDYITMHAPIWGGDGAASAASGGAHDADDAAGGGAHDAGDAAGEGAAVAAGGVTLATQKQTTGSYSDTMRSACEAEKLDAAFATKLNLACPRLKGHGLRFGPNVGLYSTGGYAGGPPRVADIICMGCKTTMSDFYQKYGAEKSHLFCYKEQGANFDKTCVGISESTTPTFLYTFTPLFLPRTDAPSQHFPSHLHSLHLQ